jgi:hypothetical protein
VHSINSLCLYNSVLSSHKLPCEAPFQLTRFDNLPTDRRKPGAKHETIIHSQRFERYITIGLQIFVFHCILQRLKTYKPCMEVTSYRRLSGEKVRRRATHYIVVARRQTPCSICGMLSGEKSDWGEGSAENSDS